MESEVTSLKRTARLAGLLYLILVITAIYGAMYVSSKIFVQGDVVATSNNILANEFLFRTGIVGLLISTTVFIFLVLVLYKLLRHVNEHQAKLMVTLVIVQIPIVFLIETFKITSLMILKGEVLKELEPQQLQDLALIFRRLGGYGTSMVEIFWGLWLIPFGQLVYRSGFIPRIFGVVLIIAGIGYITNWLTFMLLPNYHTFTQLPVLISSALGEIAIILWLLIMGVKVQKITAGSTTASIKI